MNPSLKSLLGLIEHFHWQISQEISDTIPYLKPSQEPGMHQSHEDRAT